VSSRAQAGAVRLAQIFLVAMTIYSQTYRLGFAICPPSRGHDGDRAGIGIVLARARKERLALIGVIRVLSHKRRAHDVMADLQVKRDRDVCQSDILTSRIVRRFGKHPSEQGVFSMAVVDEFAEAFLLHGYPPNRLNIFCIAQWRPGHTSLRSIVIRCLAWGSSPSQWRASVSISSPGLSVL
jgi:hypothetical protein